MKVLLGPLSKSPRENDLISLKEIVGKLTKSIDFKTFNLKYYDKNGMEYNDIDIAE